ncbi:hypothetical protein, partial [Streptomyces sp. C]|uniref:hypothetical protein n=1 Tax=Streptomyces sp. C TaxID=253839 RepID=UPI001F504FFF
MSSTWSRPAMRWRAPSSGVSRVEGRVDAVEVGEDGLVRLDVAVLQVFAQVLGERGGGGVVEQEGGGQLQAGVGREAVAQFDGAERVEAQVLEGPCLLDPVGGAVAEDRGGVSADQFDEEVLLFGGRGGGEPLPEGGGLGGRPLPGARLVVGQRGSYVGQFADQCAVAHGRVGGGEQRPVDVGDADAGLVEVEGLLEGRDGGARGDADHSAAAQEFVDVLGGRHAGF